MIYKSISACFIIALSLQAVCTKEHRCKALVLQAGGDLGSFEAGALSAFVNTLSDDEIKYSVITGVSIGSVNALQLSQFPIGQEKEMSEWLVNLWKPLKQKDVYTTFKGGILQGLLYETGIFDSTPARKLLEEKMISRPRRKVNMGTCNLKTGQFTTYDENRSLQDLIQVAMSSGSVPGFFPYQTYDHQMYIDGGVCGKLVDINSAIRRCREEVDDDSLIDIDIIWVQFSELNQEWAFNQKKKTLEVLRRYHEVQNHVQKYRELIEAFDYHPEVNYRYIVYPKEPLYTPSVPFRFNNEQINDMISQGFNDASYFLKQGPQQSFNEALEQSYKGYLKHIGLPYNETNKKLVKDTISNRINSYNKLKESLQSTHSF